ncbi:MAG: fluoride efflux transporter CrcB [Phycisphaerales bacterium]|nr:MAG: fluoride efflux transporter CrcB [Phycisphaerales bacterium]
MLPAILVGLGGGTGAIARYLVGLASLKLLGDRFPFATLFVNVLGCLLIGALISAWTGGTGEARSPHEHVRLLLVTGLLGGFTTFSAFGLETFTLYKQHHLALAALNIMLNIVLGIAAVALGIKLGRTVA